MDCLLLADQFLAMSAAMFGMLAQAKVEEQAATGISWGQYLVLGVGLAVLILPFFVGGYLAKSLKMPNYGTRFGFILLAMIASAVMLAIPRGEDENRRRGPGLGVDLQGGTILVYEIDPEKNKRADGEAGVRVKSEDLIEPLTRRINPSGTQEIVLRPYGESEIEIIVPAVDQREVDRIKRTLEQAGIMRFAILANTVDHQLVIDLAGEQSRSERPNVRTQREVRDINGAMLGLWAEVDYEKVPAGKLAPLRVGLAGTTVRNPETGQLLNVPAETFGAKSEFKQAKWIKDIGLDFVEVLMIVQEELDVKGEDLAFASSTFDQNGSPAVAFTLTDEGSGKFFALTTENAPVGTRQKQLGIIMDDKLLSAPNILQPIQKEGRITGNFTREEVDSLVAVLKAGQLPAALTKQPIAENQIDATLGADTIRKGVIAIVTSLVLVLLFILFYYRFAGFVACLALVLNLAMILATMVFINQPLTLPGLAGLVLTVGMSVDANVLIFERIREELKKGAANRMAVRNGFANATVTIVDANLTTLITAIVLYAIGTDQIRGFAVTLILGILFSMFTAIYMSRTFFDVAERRGFLTLSMSDGVNSIRSAISGEGNLDFIGKGKLTLALSGILICIGVASLFVRGNSIFDIDFAGGSSVQFRIDKPTDSEDIRSIVGKVMTDDQGDKIDFTVNGVSMADADEKTVYKVDSSIDEVDVLKNAIQKAFAEDTTVNLVSYNVQIKPTSEASSRVRTPARSGSVVENNGVMLAAFYSQDPDGAESTPNEDAPSEQDGADTPDTAAADGDADAAATDTNAADDSDVTPATADVDDAAAGSTGPLVPNSPMKPRVNVPGTRVGSNTMGSVVIQLGVGGGTDNATVNEATLLAELEAAAKTQNIPLNTNTVILTPYGDKASDWKSGSSLQFSKWKVELPAEANEVAQIVGAFQAKLGNEPIWISSSKVGKRVAGDMIGRALGALFASLLCIIGYIWFRFQRVIYGLAAVAALLHDVLITLGAIAVSYWLADVFGVLGIDPFKISLTVVAALLTIIGYSLNDTIVVFDRIRETKGKAPRLTGEMINVSINQTLSRTLLTSITTLIVVVLLYAFGGEGIHAFAFALVIGVLVGTYSSIFVASPILLWLVERNEKKTSKA